MKYDLIRLVLVSRAQTSLFEEKGPDGAELSREQWLRTALSSEISFKHNSRDFRFIPHENTSHDARLLIGMVGRQVKDLENAPPERSFAIVEREPWAASLLIIDPTHHSDGQKIAFEAKTRIGKSVSVVRSLAAHLNSYLDSKYIIEANSIVNPETFWEFERANRDQITSITFDFIAPNMFGTRDTFDKEMADVRDNEKARSTSITLNNDDGLRLNNSRIERAVNFALEGGGSIRARTKKRRNKFNSTDNAKNVIIELPKDIDKTSLSATIGMAVTSIFGESK